MAVKFVFEDRETTPSSILLKSSYNGNNIFFAGGSRFVLKKALEIKTNNDIVYILYDVSPNNLKTKNGYADLVNYIISSDIDNIYVIPIICIEYFLCRLLDKLDLLSNKENEDLVQNLVKIFNWDNISERHKLDNYINSSLEHAYKYIISTTKLQCTHNAFKYKKSNLERDEKSSKGIFYEKDCNCISLCNSNCTYSLATKAELLYTSLPIFTITSENHLQLMKDLNTKFMELDYEKLNMNLQKFLIKFVII